MTRPTGMTGFAIIWVGQFSSMMGSGMTRFALIFWLYGETGSATSLGLLGLASFAPTILLAPFSGILIDRISRSLAMALSDLVACYENRPVLLM
jgi:DHA3 family macrolide efflux protein-like MFS transporter